ncbi:MAG: FtsQ-type POTRA domain-containing protein [Deltaproteobacteria bacterium]
MSRQQRPKKGLKKTEDRTAVPGNTFRRLGSGFLKVTIVMAAITLLSLFFLSVYHYLLKSPYMRLERVQMTGVDDHLKAELMALCGLNTEPNLLAINLEDLKKQIEEHPWIRNARLQRQLPHTLTIDIEEQTPVAILLSDRMVYVNSHGEPFKAVTQSENVDFPIITGISDDLKSDENRLETVAHVMHTLSNEHGIWAADNLSEINVREEGEVALYYRELGAEIVCNWRNLSEKIPGLRRLADHLKSSGKIDRVRRIDLDYADGAVVSFEAS